MILEENRKKEEEYITIDLDSSKITKEKNNAANKATAKKTTRIGKNKKEKKSKIKWDKKKVRMTIAIIVAILIVALGVVVGTYIYKAEGDVKQAVLDMTSDIVGTDDPIFVLVLGISEDITSKLTDTIMLAGYNPESQKAFIISIPRDTFVGTNENTASGWDKINALYQKDINKTIKAVEELTGVNIDNYVIVRNTMLSALVDAIGEVEFDVPIDMDYDDPTQDLHIHLKAGVQKIDRDEAEQLLRFRHNNDGSSYPSSWGDNDYGRMRTQREFIKAVAGQLISVNNVTKLKSIAEAVFSNLETNISMGKAISYIPSAINFNVDELRMEQLPGSGAMLNNLSFYKASYARSKTLMNELIEYLELDEKETKKYYTNKIKKTVSTTTEKEDECDHKYTSEITKKSTCQEQGARKYTCSLCKSNYIESIATTEHTYNERGICTVCGGKKQPAEHKCEFTKLVYTELPATCTTNGSGTYQCEYDGCKKTQNLSIKATGHNYINGKCNNCGEKEKTAETTPTQKPSQAPAVCTHTNTKESKINATCGKTGSITIICSDCGNTISTETLPATGTHTPGTPVTTPATCTADGNEKTSCTVCGTTISSTNISATGHSYSNGSCSKCGASDPNYVPETSTPDVVTNTVKLEPVS